MNEQLIAELKKLCPVSYDQSELNKLISKAKADFEVKGKYQTKVYQTMFAMLSDIESRIKSGQKIIPDKSKLTATKSYQVTYELSKVEQKSKLAETLQAITEVYSIEVEKLQEAWLDSQIKSEIEKDLAEKAAAEAARVQEFKQSLLEAFKSASN